MKIAQVFIKYYSPFPLSCTGPNILNILKSVEYGTSNCDNVHVSQPYVQTGLINVL
jgi:hypothetical protein